MPVMGDLCSLLLLRKIPASALSCTNETLSPQDIYAMLVTVPREGARLPTQHPTAVHLIPGRKFSSRRLGFGRHGRGLIEPPGLSAPNDALIGLDSCGRSVDVEGSLKSHSLVTAPRRPCTIRTTTQIIFRSIIGFFQSTQVQHRGKI
jgi:hypothetical protein